MLQAAGKKVHPSPPHVWPFLDPNLCLTKCKEKVFWKIGAEMNAVYYKNFRLEYGFKAANLCRLAALRQSIP